jgi:hypothetical protein
MTIELPVIVVINTQMVRLGPFEQVEGGMNIIGTMSKQQTPNDT